MRVHSDLDQRGGGHFFSFILIQIIQCTSCIMIYSCRFAELQRNDLNIKV